LCSEYTFAFRIGLNHNTFVVVTNLSNHPSEAAFNEMESATLHLSLESTAALAQVVHAKSNGNAVHAQQYQRLKTRPNLLEFRPLQSLLGWFQHLIRVCVGKRLSVAFPQ
jgi:hypothetical protein